MREILFRGKRLDNREWVEGGIVQGVLHELWRNADRAYITIFPEYLSSVNLVEVDPATVGQYTGLKDKNGKRIFEGDIVEQIFEKSIAVAPADLWGNDEYVDLFGREIGVVAILPSKGTCIKNPISYREENGESTVNWEKLKMYKNVCQGRCEIIGTIHDNPELMEVKE